VGDWVISAAASSWRAGSARARERILLAGTEVAWGIVGIPHAVSRRGVAVARVGDPPPDKSYTIMRPTDFVLVTHMRWSESPRLRHQAARLRRDAGHRMLFVERADPAWRTHQSLPMEVQRNIWTVRPTPSMHHLKGNHASSQIYGLVRAWEPSTNDTSVIFTHDGWLLRRVFPRNRLLTLKNDDFEAHSGRFGVTCWLSGNQESLEQAPFVRLHSGECRLDTGLSRRPNTAGILMQLNTKSLGVSPRQFQVPLRCKAVH
jgi:hypothetical protein